MKKQTKSEKIRRAMVIAVASMMVMGMPMVVNAEEEGADSSESKSSSESSSDSHESKSESSSTSHESSEKASSASSESKKAESSAKESSETASSKSEEAKSAASEAKSAADSVNSDSEAKNEMSSKVSEAKDAVDKAADTVAEKDAEYASSSETKTADSSEETSSTETGSEETSGTEDDTEEAAADSGEAEKAEEIKEAKEITQGLEKAIESIESAESSISGQADAIKESTGAAIADMKKNFEKVFSDDATITQDERKEAAQAVVKAKEAVDLELAKAEKAKEKAEEELAQAQAEYNEYLTKYSEITNSVYNQNKEDVTKAVEKAAQDVADAQATMTEKLGAYNDAAAECVAAADAAQAASEAAKAAAEKAELAYHEAEKAAEDAENAVDADQITDAEKDNIYFAQVDTANATLKAREYAEEAVAAAKEAEQQRKEVEAALDKQITDAEDTLAKAQENLAMVQRQAYKYNNVLALDAMLQRLQKAEQAVAEAAQALDVAQKEAATYKEFADYYLDDGKRTFTAYAQKETKDGVDVVAVDEKIYKDFDATDGSMGSQKTQYFTQVSADKMEVSDEIYRLYLKAMMSNRDAMNKNGVGIATGIGANVENAEALKGGSMPVIYWKVDENNKLTGEYFTDITYQPDGRYFVGYAFKRESDMSKKGYHIDGFMIDHKLVSRDYEEIPEVPGNWDPNPKTPETPSTPNTNPGGGNGGNGGNGGGNPGTTTPVVTITDDSVALADMIDQAAIEILDGPVALASSVPGDVIIGDEDVPLADSIPQTGDNAVSVLPVMLSGIAAIGAALGLGKKKEEK